MRTLKLETKKSKLCHMNDLSFIAKIKTELCNVSNHSLMKNWWKGSINMLFNTYYPINILILRYIHYDDIIASKLACRYISCTTPTHTPHRGKTPMNFHIYHNNHRYSILLSFFDGISVTSMLSTGTHDLKDILYFLSQILDWIYTSNKISSYTYHTITWLKYYHDRYNTHHSLPSYNPSTKQNNSNNCLLYWENFVNFFQNKNLH